MLDVGWTEILVIAIVLIIVVGPKDLPQMLRTFGRMVSKMRGMASDFRQQFDEALREADLEDVRKTLGEAQKLNPLNSIRDAVNPLRQMGNEIKADLERKPGSTTATPASASPESVSAAPAAVPSEAQVPASTEPVAAAPLKKGPTRKTAAKKPAETAGKATKAAATKAETGKKAAAKPAARKAASTKAATTKTRKGDA
jgi:sec-independent protein translocase protein TatB